MTTAGVTPPASPPVPFAPTLSADDWAAHHLGRAVDCWLAGDVRGAAVSLEMIDISPTSTFPQADRAAFLLAAAYLQLNDAAAFERVAARAASPSGTPYRRWIRYLQIAQASGRAPEPGAAPVAPAGFPAGEIMNAAQLLEAGQAREALSLLETSKPQDEVASIHLYLRALARRTLGEDPARDWEALSAREARNPLEADLVGHAVLELAAGLVEQPERARRALDRMPPTSRLYPRALELRATLAIASGDTATAYASLKEFQKNYPSDAANREVQLLLGGVMMDRKHWFAALRYFESADDEWSDESGLLTRLETASDLATVWTVWERRQDWRDEIRLAPEALLAETARLAATSLVLDREPSLTPGEGLAAGLWPPVETAAVAAWDSAGVLVRHAPSPAEWERVRALQRRVQDAEGALARQDHLVAERTRELERRRRYLEIGAARAVSSADTLTAAVRQMDALIARLGAVLAELERVRDAALSHVAARTRDMTTEIERELVFMRAIRHFYVDGPNRSRPESLPPGAPSPAEVMAREEALAVEAGQFLHFFAEHYAGVIQRSFDQAWRPRLGESGPLRAGLQAELVRARRIGSGVDSTLAALSHDPVLAAATLRRDRLAGALDSLRTVEGEARREVAAAVAARARVGLAAEREAIDYRLADASYELAVDAITRQNTPADSVAAVALRDRAIGHLDAFLARHPESGARGESRYRLADLHLLRARDEFRGRMAQFLDQAPASSDFQNRTVAPLVDYAPAIATYEAILREDPDFPHLDAVLFNLGMILADDGQPSAMQHLSRLVTEYPASPDVQEAWLRMGNDRFDHEDFAGAAPFFEHAIEGKNPSFTAMALYKLGWSRFEEDRFDEATDAFARLIDHYDQHADIARSMDLRDEAEEYLVHSLARSGGAPAFQRHFDRTGPRRYEARVLTSLAALLRGVSLFGEAAECERLWLSRYPSDPEALAVAERLVDTYRRWNKPELARETKRAQAEQFLPGSAWYRAQKEDSVRAAAEKFARGAFRETAAYRHTQARKTGDPAAWREALSQYETYLAHWPDAGDSPRLHYLASETAAKVGDYPRALKHLSATITCDSLSLVLDASWQRVAIGDEWYRRSQARSTATPKLGTDSLATVVLKIGDEFTSRFASDPRCADVAWRQGNVALAHGRYADAAVRLERFGERYPADKRALTAVLRSGDARYRLSEFDVAGATYEKALALARGAGRDSVVTALETTIPTCYYQHAERVARADSTRGEQEAAPLFARVARAWPRFAHADLALYRAGLGYAARGSHADATGAWEELLRVHPKSEYARDSAIQVAIVHEKSKNPESAARAYERFAALFPGDPDAASALLKSADLLAAAGHEAEAERARSRFLESYPGETAAVMEIRAARSEKELAAVAAGTGSVSALLAKKSSSDLKAYLLLAEAHPDLASAPILARCDYLRAEEVYAEYAGVRLTQPLPSAIEKKKAKLEALLAAYDRCSKRGVTEYTRASAHRIGQALIAFGDALLASERPRDVTGDDLLAYEDVLAEQSWAFFDRGEDVWSELLRQTRHEKDDPGGWVARTRDLLWPRLAQRFQFQPEVRYPLVAGTPPPPEPASP
jgi:tetratricopeptide (TPR) repeat protein